MLQKEKPPVQAAIDHKQSNYTTYADNYFEIIDKFRQAMVEAGLHYDGEIIPDGKLHRFYVDGHKHGTKNGAYTLFFDSHPAGWFMDYKSGLFQKWKSSRCSRVSNNLSKQINETKRQRDRDIRQKQEIAANKAVDIWNKSKSISSQSDHAYLINKHIQPHGARAYRGSLVIPVHDQSNCIVNLQFITSEGKKRFLSGGRKHGCYFAIGDLTDRILIGEGFATCASLYEDSGCYTVVAFDAGNLLSVAKVISAKFPACEIIVCGDNDLSGVGQTKAIEAALFVNGKVLIPSISGTDWNDCLTGGKVC